ncbi:hypothetical protein [Plantactinospora sp. GCM10030261]|uniref:hypothetical protein n=1 Tax=Plantactinospora sp. GCM10030261 TaxID=3273420 RepID=UPI003613D159
MVDVRGDPEALREIGMVLAVALAGVLLAGIAAFTPWYEQPRTAVVDLRSADTSPAAEPVTAG